MQDEGEELGRQLVRELLGEVVLGHCTLPLAVALQKRRLESIDMHDLDVLCERDLVEPALQLTVVGCDACAREKVVQFVLWDYVTVGAFCFFLRDYPIDSFAIGILISSCLLFSFTVPCFSSIHFGNRGLTDGVFHSSSFDAIRLRYVDGESHCLFFISVCW